MTLSAAAVRRVDRTCDRFESAWKSGERPDPAAYLAGAEGAERAALLRQLLLLDWDYRLHAGDTPRAADYDTRFPDDSALVADVSREAASAVSTPPEPVTVETTNPAGVLGSRYDLRQEVGQGGIGVVFRAHDQHLGRELAVKVLREPYSGRQELRQRFVAEGQIGSQLQHPGIVPVYDLGTCAARGPFIAMKLVEGHTFAALLRTRPAPSHDLPRFLGVFVQVCHAVAYAHDRGIIHRDLKPQNVMVGAFGEVQVMDWGLAKSVAGNGEPGTGERLVAATRGGASDTPTLAGTLLGTPAYMPPEQARGESAHVDPRSDVFALGAILCQILTGTPPYVNDSNDELCRLAAAGELAGAFARLDDCGADPALRALAKRCLAADRAARPADARAVARDVTAYLNSAQERVRQAEVARAAAEARAAVERRARRRLVALAAALLVGAGVAAWQAVVAIHAKRDAVTAAEHEGEARRAAETAAASEAAAKRTAEAAAASEAAAKRTAEAKEAETRAVLHFVEKRVLAAGRPKGSGGLGPNATLWAALAAAEPFVSTSFKDQPLTEARIRHTLGSSLFAVGNYPEAAVQLEAARALYERFRGADDHDALAMGVNIAICLNMQGRTPDAVALWEALLPKCQEKLGRDADTTLNCMNNLATGYLRLKQLDRAEAMLQGVVEVRGKSGPNTRDALTARTNLAAVYLEQKRYEKALELGIPTWEAMKQGLGDGDHDTLNAAANIAIVYQKLQRYDDALKSGKVILGLRVDKFTRGHPATIQSVCFLAECYTLTGRGADAVRELDTFLRACKGQAVHPSVLSVVNMRLRIFEKANDAAGCRATAELWEDQGRGDYLSLDMAATCRAVTATVLRAANATREADAEADRAMAWLRQAKAAGLRDWDKVRNDRDFAVLRGRADFRQLTESDR